MKKRDIFIVICVIAFGITYNAIQSGEFEISFYEGCSINPRSLLDKRHPNDFTRSELRYTTEDVKKIKLDNPAGGIIVEKSSDADADADTGSVGVIRVIPVVRVYHRKKEKAAQIEKDIKIRISENEEKVHIAIQPAEDFPFRRVRVNFKLVVPEAVELDLWNRYGDIAVDGGGKNISLDEKYGDVSVSRVDSNIKIIHKHGNVALRDIKGSINLSSKYSRIGIKNAAALKLKFAHAKVSIAGIEKETDIGYAAYSSLAMEDGNGFTIDGRHTKIKLHNIKNGVNIKNSHQSITMEDITGDINISARHCKIQMEQVVSDSVVIRNAYDYIGIEGITAKNLDILTSHGNLDIAFDRVEERINIKSKHSKITLAYPASVQPQFSISSKYGKIVSRTSADFTILKEKQGVSLNSKEGKPGIIINNPYGTVILKDNRAEPQKIETGKVETEEFSES